MEVVYSWKDGLEVRGVRPTKEYLVSVTGQAGIGSRKLVG